MVIHFLSAIFILGVIFIFCPWCIRHFFYQNIVCNTYPYSWCKSDQPDQVRLSKLKKFFSYYTFADGFLILFLYTILFLPKIIIYFLILKKKAFSAHFRIEGNLGVTVDPLITSKEELLILLNELQVNCINIRIKCWERENIEKILTVCNFFHLQKFSIILTLLQNREAVRNIDTWEDFVFNVISASKDFVEGFQIGHAPNRVKWGIWDIREYCALYNVAYQVAQNFKEVNLLAPSVIDFEWFFLNGILKKIKKKPPFAVSHLLYTDTRIKPEYGSFGFNIWKKVCFLKSIIEVHSPNTPLWITEVNWPLKGQGDYAPAAGKAMVSEEGYANYLIRYFILTLCTGYVERIYWFQLVARGYGLVDNTDGLRKRQGFYAFKTFVKNIGKGKFIKNLSKDGIYKFVFKSNEDSFIMVAWTPEDKRIMSLPEECEKVVLRDGEVIMPQKDINITESPVYIYYRNYE